MVISYIESMLLCNIIGDQTCDMLLYVTIMYTFDMKYMLQFGYPIYHSNDVARYVLDN